MKKKIWIVVEENCYEVEARTAKEAIEMVEKIGLQPYNTEYSASQKA